jgi:hypothetical protein
MFRNPLIHKHQNLICAELLVTSFFLRQRIPPGRHEHQVAYAALPEQTSIEKDIFIRLPICNRMVLHYY